MRAWLKTVNLIMKRTLLVLVSVLLSAVLLELFLRVYNPTRSTTRGDRIVLSTNQKWQVSSPPNSLLDSEVLHVKNNIGFRGEDYHEAGDPLRVFTIGGSTTENTYLTEGKTWSDVLLEKLQGNFRNIWLNNAGFSGHSTFAHKIMVQDHVRQYGPDVLVFLIGMNDVHRDDLNVDQLRIYQPAVWPLARHSELAALLLNISRGFRAERRNLTHDTGGLQENWIIDWEVSPDDFAWAIPFTERLLPGYRDRLSELVEVAQESGTAVVLVTQPVLYGEGIDDRTGLDLAKIHINGGQDGKTAWNVLQMYNAVTREVARDKSVHLIDLSQILPKSSYYFYDTMHFTNEGAQEVADILYRGVCDYMSSRFSNYLISEC